MKKVTKLFGLFLLCTTAFSAPNIIAGPGKITQTKKDFEMTIVHINDHHSHLEEEKLELLLDGKKTKVTVGGISRVAEAINNVRATEENTLVLHAGDAITGTLYYTLFNGKADAEMMNAIKFDAFTLGNHEFDGKNETLKGILDVLTIPTVSANVVADKGSILENRWTPYLIKEIGGEKIGIIGIDIVGKTKNSSSPGNDIQFYDEIQTAQKYADELTSMGINKIILLSHFGYDNNVELAKKVSGVDVIVSGDTHYLLGENFEKYGLKVDGDYPTIINSKSGEPVYVVEAWNYSYVLGQLKVTFNNNGIITHVEGKPTLLLGDDFFERRDSQGKKYQLTGSEKDQVIRFIQRNEGLTFVNKDAKVETLMQKYQKEKETLAKEVIGTVQDEILAGSENRIPDAKNPDGSFGAQLVAESMLYVLQSMGTGEVDITIQNAGGVRITLQPGEFSYETGFTLLPFSNTLYTLEMSGKEIKQVLEEAIDYSLQPQGSTGAFPYGAGIRYEAKKEGTLGKRITKIEVQDRKTKEWKPLEESKMYVVGTSAYTASGKDGYVTFGKVTETRGGTDTYLDDAKAFIDYVKYIKVLKRPVTTNVKFEF